MSAAFDTLRLARTLRDKARFTTEQAEGMADAIAEVMQGDLATKSDLMATKLELRAEIQSVRTDLRGEINAAKNDTIRWVVGMIGFQTIAILGAALALARAFVK